MPAAGHIVTDIYRDAIKPRFIAARLVQIAEVLIELQEHFLGGILGILRIIQQTQRHAENPAFALRHDALEGGQVAGVFPPPGRHAQCNIVRLHF
jgi:hypothetical protein